MLKEYKTRTNLGVGIGIALQMAGALAGPGVVPGDAGAFALVGGFGSAHASLMLTLAGLVFFIWGCCSYAKGKGYSGWWGMLGLLSCVGLVILVLVPDRHQ